MNNNAKDTRVNIVPTLRYQDVPAAIDWLQRAFGFEPKLVVPGENDTITHAQLVFGHGMIMLGSVRDDDFGTLRAPPEGPDRRVTQSVLIIVDDVDAHHDRARAAGAEIVSEPVDQPYGGRFYSCRDPEGHVWNVGSYDPWAEL